MCCFFLALHYFLAALESKTAPSLQYTDLELAINTLVENFHSASSTNANTLTAQEFQSMLSKELPTMVKVRQDPQFNQYISVSQNN